MSNSKTSTEDRALVLLGQGLAPEMVASAIGVTPSAISQLLSQEEFSIKVAELRYTALASHTSRDAKYDAMEDKLLQRLESTLGMLFDPMKIAKLLQVINGAKRRGITAPENITPPSTVVQLNMPTQIFAQFVTNVNNQVIRAGEQELITVQSGNMTKLLDASNLTKLKDQNVQVAIPTSG